MNEPQVPDPQNGWNSAFAVYAAAGIALLAAVLMALFARGLAGDEEAAHYLIARYAFTQPTLFLSEVGRPLVTIALSLPAQLGLLGARLASALAVGLTAILVARTARRTGWVEPGWAVLFLVLQPFYLAHAGTAMTEPWTALLLAWALASFAENRPGQIAVAGALLPLARLEMVVLWPIMVALFWKQRRLVLAAVLPLGMLLWNFFGALAGGDPLYLLHLQPRIYPAREPLIYAKSMVWVLGWGVFVPVVVGLARAASMSVRRGSKKRALSEGEAAGRRVLAASAVVAVLAFALYTYLAVWRPLTFGNLRYLAFFAPLFALLAAAGVDLVRRSPGRVVWAGLAVAAVGALVLWGHPLHESFEPLERRTWWPAAIVAAWAVLAVSPRPIRAAAPALAAALALASLGIQHRGLLHLQPNAEQQGMAEAVGLLDARMLGDRPVYSAHPLLAFFLERNAYDRELFPPVTGPLRDAAPPGALWFWDSHYTPRPGADFGAASLREDPRWRYLGGAAAPDSTWAGAFFERVAPGAAALAAGGMVSGGLERESWFTVAEYVGSGAGYAARAAAADPNDAERWRILADRLAASGRREDAREALANAERIAPGDPRNLAIRAAMLADEGRTDEAEEAARRAYEARPEDPYLRFLYGRILWERGRPQEARPLILESADRLEGRWDTHLLAGAVCLDTGDLAGAERHYRAALAVHPGLVQAHFRLAQLALRRGDPGLGIEHLRSVIDLQPGDAQAYVLLGELYQRLNRPGEARAVWSEGLTRTGGDSTLASRLRDSGP